MRRIWIWGGAAIIGSLLLVFGGAAIYLILNPVDLSEMRTEIENEIRAATGREVKISGPISLGVSLVPYLAIEGLSVANEPWGKSSQFLAIERVHVRVELFSLLHGAIEVAAFEAKNATLHLEVDGLKRENWLLKTGKDGGDAIIKKMRFENLLIDYRDIKDSQAKYSLQLAKAELQVTDDEGVFELSGILGENEIKADGRVAPFYRTDAKSPRRFDVKANAFGVAINAKGNAKFPFSDASTAAVFEIKSAEGLGRLLEFFGIRIKDIGGFDAKGKIAGAGGALKISEFTARYGDSDVAGEMRIGIGKKPLQLGAALHSGMLDLSVLSDMLESKPTAPQSRQFSTKPFDARLPTTVDFEFQYGADELHLDDKNFKNIDLSSSLKDGALRAERIDFEIASAKISSTANITPRGEGFAVTAKLRADAVDLNQMAKLFDGPEIADGRALVLFEGKSAGNSPALLAAGLNGRFYVELEDGRIPSKFSSMMSGDVVDVFKNFTAAISGRKNEKIECALAAFEIIDGIARAKSMLLLTQQAAVTGSGRINLGQESLHIDLKPQPRNVSMVNLATGLRLRGTLSNPKFEINKASVAKKAGVSALGFASGPLGMVAGSVASALRSQEQKNPVLKCDAAKQAAITGLANWPELR